MKYYNFYLLTIVATLSACSSVKKTEDRPEEQAQTPHHSCHLSPDEQDQATVDSNPSSEEKEESKAPVSPPSI